MQFADDETRINQSAAALTQYDLAIAQAQQIGDAKLESLALVHRADLQSKNGDAAAAAQSYQRGLALDAKRAATRKPKLWTGLTTGNFCAARMRRTNWFTLASGVLKIY